MIRREMEGAFATALADYAATVVYGPRQSGKTTLAQMCCAGFNYANLEDKETRELAREDYKAFFHRYPAPLVIDEVQRLPEILECVSVRNQICDDVFEESNRQPRSVLSAGAASYPGAAGL